MYECCFHSPLSLRVSPSLVAVLWRSTVRHGASRQVTARHGTAVLWRSMPGCACQAQVRVEDAHALRACHNRTHYSQRGSESFRVNPSHRCVSASMPSMSRGPPRFESGISVRGRARCEPFATTLDCTPQTGISSRREPCAARLLSCRGGHGHGTSCTEKHDASRHVTARHGASLHYITSRHGTS